jgi:hypothetical protein
LNVGTGAGPQVTTVVDIVDWLESQLARLADDLVANLVTCVDVYRDGEVPLEDLRLSVEQNMRLTFAAVRNPAAPRDLTGPEETGRRRAHQGVALPEVLRAFRMGSTIIWDAVAERARAHPDPDTVDAVLTVTARLWELNDQHSVALTESYRATTAELLIAQQQRRSALLEALFTGDHSPDVSPWEIPRLLGLQPNVDVAVVAAETPATAEEGLPGVESRLARRGIVSAWRLTPDLQMGVVSLRPGQFDLLRGVLDEMATTRVGISPTFRLLRDTPRALHLARVALSSVEAGRGEVAQFSTAPLAALVASDVQEARRIAEEVLGAVLKLPAQERTMLLDTLQAWFDQAGSAERAADQLHCHPNTVRYRLRRLHELIDRSLTEPYAIADVAAALRALQLAGLP